MTDPTVAGKRRLMVFSHPNHELGMYGLAQKVRPHFVFLTDGNSQRRFGESRAGLAAIGLEEQATYLKVREGSVYEAFLDRDAAFFRDLVERVRAVVDAVEPEQVFCDAVEFYNPSHDMSLPVTRAALAGRPDPELFEVPLIYERKSGSPKYVMQRVVPSRRDDAVRIELTQEEAARKLHARDEIYGLLREDLGERICGISAEDLALEEVRPADAGPSALPDECVLRYEYRGELLKQSGEVQRALTYSDHYLPVARELFAAGAS